MYTVPGDHTREAQALRVRGAFDKYKGLCFQHGSRKQSDEPRRDMTTPGSLEMSNRPHTERLMSVMKSRIMARTSPFVLVIRAADR